MSSWVGRSSGVLVALVAAVAGWVTSWSWAPLYAVPHRYLVPGAICAVLVAAAGAGCRAVRLPAYVTPVVQLVACIAFLPGWFHDVIGDRSRLPTPAALADLARAAVHGSEQLNAYASPVPARYVDVAPFLTVCAVALLVALDLFGCGLRRVPLAGLPILLSLTIPISVLTERLSVWVFLGVAAAYLVLLAVQHTRDLHGWGREAGGATSDRTTGVSVVAGRIGAAAVVGALVLPLLVPVSRGIFNGHDDNGPTGTGTQGVTLVNPLIEIRRDLLRKTHTPMVTATTDDRDPSYLQLTVLDQFTGDEWRASDRHLPAGNRVNNDLPVAPGMSSTFPGQRTNWHLKLASTFDTSWLPVPTPTSGIEVSGDWRYDSRTLDVVDTRDITNSEGLSYRVQAIHPAYDANALNAAGPPVGESVDGMTDLPKGMPPVIARIARQVTRHATTEYQEAHALQEWFRSTGGFTYSTRPAPGNGMQLLANFITRDKVGYCEQFAAAMAVMARTLGIPSRVVVGFLNPTGPSSGHDNYLFTSDDLHAWPEIYFSGSGWVHFEPTPSVRTGAAPAFTEQPLQRHHEQQPTRAAKPSHVKQDKPRPELPTGSTTGQGGGLPTWSIWLLVLVVLAGGAAVPRMLRERQRRRRLRPVRDPRVLARGAWDELRATTIDHRIGWADRRSPRQAAALVRSRVTADPDLVAQLTWLTAFVERARYARAFELAPSEADRVREVVLAWCTAMRDGVSPRTARRARWWPASLFDRTPPEAGASEFEEEHRLVVRS